MLNRARSAGSQTNVLPVDGKEDHSSSIDVCSRQGSLQGGEPLEVDDDDEIF